MDLLQHAMHKQNPRRLELILRDLSSGGSQQRWRLPLLSGISSAEECQWGCQRLASPCGKCVESDLESDCECEWSGSWESLKRAAEQGLLLVATSTGVCTQIAQPAAQERRTSSWSRAGCLLARHNKALSLVSAAGEGLGTAAGARALGRVCASSGTLVGALRWSPPGSPPKVARILALGGHVKGPCLNTG